MPFGFRALHAASFCALALFATSTFAACGSDDKSGSSTAASPDAGSDASAGQGGSSGGAGGSSAGNAGNGGSSAGMGGASAGTSSSGASGGIGGVGATAGVGGQPGGSGGAGGTSGSAGTGGTGGSGCPPTDIQPVTCTMDTECADEQTCLKGVCINDCGYDLAAHESGLGDVFTPVAGFCGRRARRGFPRVTVENGCERWSYRNFGISGTFDATDITWVTNEYDYDRESFTIRTVSSVQGTEPSPGDAGGFFPGGISLSPDDSHFVTSVHTGGFVVGQAYSLAIGASSWVEGPAVSARGVSHLDATTVLLANGDVSAASVPFTDMTTPPVVITGVPENGAISVRVLPTLGYVAVGNLRFDNQVDQNIVSDLYFVPLADVTARVGGGMAPIDVTSHPNVVTLLELPEGIDWLGDDFLVSGLVSGDSVLRRMRLDNGSLVFDAPVPFAQGRGFEKMLYLGQGRVMLGFFEGAAVQGQVYGLLPL